MSKEEAMIDKVAEQADKNREKVDFLIYDVPVELKNKYISMAKLHYDNNVWRVLSDAIDALLEERTSRVDSLEQKVDRLGEEMAIIKSMTKYSQEQKNTVTKNEDLTFGEARDQEIDTSDDLEKLKRIAEQADKRGDKENDR